MKALLTFLLGIGIAHIVYRYLSDEQEQQLEDRLMSFLRQEGKDEAEAQEATQKVMGS